MSVPGIDCDSVVEFARGRPLEFLDVVIGVLLNRSASKEQVCTTLVVSRSVFTVEALGIVPPPSPLFGKYCDVVKGVMEADDDELRYHAAVSFAVFAEYFLTVEKKATILGDICQAIVDGKSAYLIALDVIVREMEVGPTGSRMAITAVLTVLNSSSTLVRMGLEVIENTIAFLAKNFDCSGIWSVLMELLQSPDYFENCLAVFTASAKWQLKICGQDVLSVIVAKSLEYGLANPSSQVHVCEFLLRMLRSFRELFTHDVLPGVVRLATQLIERDDLDLTEQDAGSWGIALLQSILPAESQFFAEMLVSGMSSNSISPYLAAVLAYMLVDSDALRDMRVITQVVDSSLKSRPRVVVIGLELIQLLLEKEASLPYHDIINVCKTLLLVDYASSAASVALFAVIQHMDIVVDAFCQELLDLSSKAPSPYTASAVIDLITLCIPNMSDVAGFCGNLLRMLEHRMMAIKETEVMASFCYLLIEAMKCSAFSNDMIGAVLNLFMALQDTDENYDSALKCIGRMADICKDQIVIMVPPVMEHVLRRAADFQSKQSFGAALFVWRCFIKAGIDVSSFVLPMQDIILQGTNSDVVENKSTAFEAIALNMVFFPSLLLPALLAAEQACICATRTNHPALMIPIMRCFNALMTYPTYTLSPEAIEALRFVLDEVTSADTDCPGLNECQQRLGAQMSRHTITFTQCSAAAE